MPTTRSRYYRARYYDPAIGRFISEDPIQFSGGNNFYRYVNNKPLTLVDPSGEAPDDCPNCSIVVKCRGIEYKHLGRSGLRHCDARVVDRHGIEHSLTAGPTGDPLNSDLDAWNCTTANCDNVTPLPPFTGHTVYKKKKASCDTVDCLISHTDAFNALPTHPKYHAVFGPNSDTELKSGIFAPCGIKLHIRWYGSPILGLWPLF